jgi:carbonic anhydrase/acetyltransferase-like protein (isoleucine patch superfamily)
MPLYAIGDRTPSIDPTAFVHPDAVIIGKVIIGARSSIWPCAVLRGDSGTVTVGFGTSVQDGAVVHTTPDFDTMIGDHCTIGHNVHMEGCTVEDRCLIGSGAVVLPEAIIHAGSLVGAQSLIPPGMAVPSGATALGVPAKIRPDAAPTDLLSANAKHYVELAAWHSEELRRID